MDKEIGFFNDTSSSYLAEYDKVTTDGHSFRARRQKVLALIPETREGTALDVACGPGILVAGLLQKGYAVTAVDAAPEMVERTKELFVGASGVTAQVANAYSLPFADASFDVTTALGLLEYLDREKDALHEMTRTAKPGALLVLTYPHKWSPWRVINRLSLALYRIVRPRIKLTRASGHPLVHREYSEREVRGMLTQAGLKIESIVYYNFKLVPYPLDQWLPRFTVWQSKLLEHSLPRFLCGIGTGFIVAARKQR